MLRGFRVLDLATERAEMAGRVFADLGADVIKVEPPEGARARTMGPFAEDGSEPASLYWASVGLGKRSVVLDLTTASGRADVRRLAGTADVLIESFDPGYMESLGLSYEQIRADCPGLVYVSVTPFGQTGPKADDPASELVLEAAGGRGTCQGDPDREPVPLGYPQTWFHAGVQAAADAALALYERERSGLGQYLDVSVQAVMVWTLLHAMGYPALDAGTDSPGVGPNRVAPPANPLVHSIGKQLFEAADGWCSITLGLGQPGANAFQKILDWARDEQAIDPELYAADWYDYRARMAAGTLDMARLQAVSDQMWAFLKTKTKRELMDRSVQEQLFIAPLYTVSDLLADPHLKANGFWREVEGRTHPGPFATLARRPLVQDRRAPALGADQHLLDELPSPSPAQSGSTTPSRRGLILDGLKVADFSWLGVGPITGKALADHGATTIRVETERHPDLVRVLPPFLRGEPGLDHSQFYGNFNTSKLGLALDLAKPEGLEVARQLADWADVILESFRPGIMERFGLDYATLSKQRPELIMFSACIRSQRGPERLYAGTGAQGAALCGMGSITGWPDRPPSNVFGAYTDVIVPRYGASLIASALIERDRTGLGQYIDMAQVEPGIRFLEPLILDYTVNGRVATPGGQDGPYSCPRGLYRTQGEERYVAIEVETAAQWQALRSVAPLDEFADAAFDALEQRIAYRREIDAAVRDWCRDQDGEALATKLIASGVPASIARNPSELYDDPQLVHRDFFVPLEHTVMGTVPYDGLATIFSETPGKLRKAAPCLGEDTHHVLSEILGMDEHAIARLADHDVLR